jgi:hypothetical protein
VCLHHRARVPGRCREARSGTRRSRSSRTKAKTRPDARPICIGRYAERQSALRSCRNTSTPRRRSSR